MEQEDQLQDALALEQKHVSEVTFWGPAKNASMNQQKRVMGEVSSLRLVFLWRCYRWWFWQESKCSN